MRFYTSSPKKTLVAPLLPPLLVCSQATIKIPRLLVGVCALLALAVAGQGCVPTDDISNVSTKTLNEMYQQPYRPQFHFSPPAQWMNDPNGMVYHDGEYHLFYQYHPDGNTWGPMHWGHAVSKDLVHWENLPIALYPDEHGMIFSGSAVFDAQNTSGLGTAENPPLVAIFTYHDAEGEKAGRTDYQTQGIAFSTDRGRSWTKYAENPVLRSPGIPDFRDPKVFWYAPTQRWVMALAVKDHVRLYSSPNLLAWTEESLFGEGIGDKGGVWECPDLFPLPLGETGETRWVMLLSINPGGPQGGSATQYFVGDFDGKTFTAADRLVRWLDFGADNYAGVTWANAPDNRRLFIGWMSNWQYGNQVPTYDWRSAMTVPRTLHLREDFRLAQRPVEELKKLMGQARTLPETSLETPFQLGNLAPYHHLSFALAQGDDTLFELQLSSETDTVIFAIDRTRGELRFDRSRAGQADFQPDFAAVHRMAWPTAEPIEQVEIFTDAASIEIFLNGGAYTFTELVFPNNPYQRLELRGGENTRVRKLTYHEMSTIW